MASNHDAWIVSDELNFIWNEPSPTLQHQHAANGIMANSKWHKVSNQDFMPDCWCSYTRETFRCLIKTVLMLLYPDVTGARTIQYPKIGRNTFSLFLTNTEQDLLPPQVIHSQPKELLSSSFMTITSFLHTLEKCFTECFCTLEIKAFIWDMIICLSFKILNVF